MNGHNIEDYATIEAYVGKEEVPVYAFGYTYVYSLGPDLLPGVGMQEGNTNAIIKPVLAFIINWIFIIFSC